MVKQHVGSVRFAGHGVNAQLTQWCLHGLLQLSQADTAVLEWGASGPGLCSIDIIPPRSQISENEVLELLQRMSSYGKTTLAKRSRRLGLQACDWSELRWPNGLCAAHLS
jgi:hypothetical protein